MVVGDFHFVGILAFPAEDDAPLVVDLDRMESVQTAPQRLQAVAGRIAEVFKGFGFMDGDELVIRTLLDFPGDLT